MKFDINTLRRAMCAVITACVLLLGTFVQAQAQRRSRGYRDDRWNYGQQRRAQNLYRRDRRHDLQRHQREERRALRDRWRIDHDDFDNNRTWRDQRKSERRALRRHQREERRQLRETFRNRGRSY